VVSRGLIRGKYVTGIWRKIHDKELHVWLNSPCVFNLMEYLIKVWRGMWHVCGKDKNACSGLVAKPERRKSLGKVRVGVD
jgi:hypothetical protein